MKNPYGFITDYKKAWMNYRKSEDYKHTQDVLKKKGIKPPYSTNIMRSSFNAGWHSRNEINRP